MPEPRLRAALSACGGIAPLALDAAARSPDFDVVAIQDPDPAALARTGDRYGIDRRHADFAGLLAEDADFVILAGPNHVHLDQVRLAAAAGRHCLVQKPMAPTLADAEAMVEAAAAAGIRLGVVMFELGKPLHHDVRAMVAAGWLGEPTLVSAVSAHGIYLRDPPAEDDWRRDAAKVGGGAFIQLAIHHLNLAAWLLGRDVVAVAAGGVSGRTVFADETTLAAAKFEGGAMGQFAASYATDLYGFSLCGTRGRIHLLPEHVVLRGEAPFAGGILRYDTPGREVAVPLAHLADAIARAAPGVEVHAAFARWLAGRGEFPMTGERALYDMRVVDAVYRAVEEEKWIEV